MSTFFSTAPRLVVTESDVKATFTSYSAETKSDHKQMDLHESDFDDTDDIMLSFMESFKFTGFNPEDFYKYLTTEVFYEGRFSKAKVVTIISSIISLFITRGNRLTNKNQTRMSETGAARLKEIQGILGSIFQINIHPKQLTNKIITPARIAATFATITAKKFQKFEDSRVVGIRPYGMPKGFLFGSGFSLVPPTATTLFRGLGLWRDSFTMTVNPKAVSLSAKTKAKISAYSFCLIQFRSSFIPVSERIKTSVFLAESAYNSSLDHAEKHMIIFWVDVKEFYEKIAQTHTGPLVPNIMTTASSLSLNTAVINSMDQKLQGPLVTLAYNHFVATNAATQTSIGELKMSLPIEFSVSSEQITLVGTAGAEDQGASFETGPVIQ